MPSLDDILKKSATKAKLVPSRVSIATADRPYSKFEYETSLETEEIQDKEKWQQTDNKVTTNQQQTDNKVTTNPQQPVNKTELKKENWQQTGNETGNTTDNKPTTNQQQSGNKVATKTTFSELVGLQRNIIILICHECKNSRSKTTEALTLEHLSITLKCSTGVVKTTIQRLEKKGCLLRKEFKNGRGGWSKYELPDNIYHDAVRSETDNKLATNWQQTDNKLATKPATEPTTSLSSSSSVLNIKETFDKMKNDIVFIYKNQKQGDIEHLLYKHLNKKLVKHIPPIAKKLADNYWPGPLTILFDKSELVSDLITAGSKKVAIRIPSHPLFLEILKSVDFPIAAPSANPYQRISPTTAQQVHEYFQDEADRSADARDGGWRTFAQARSGRRRNG